MPELKILNTEDFLEKKQELFNFLLTVNYDDLPDFIFFTYEGYRFDLTEEFYQLIA